MRSRIVVILIFALITAALAQIPSSNTLTPNTTFDARLLKTMDVTKAKVGDRVVLENLHPLSVGATVVPYGSKVTGRILSVTSVPKNQKGVAELAFVVENISWHGGELSLSAYPVEAKPVDYGATSLSTIPKPDEFGPAPVRTIGGRIDYREKIPPIVMATAPGTGTAFRSTGNFKLLDGTVFTLRQMK